MVSCRNIHIFQKIKTKKKGIISWWFSGAWNIIITWKLSEAIHNWNASNLSVFKNSAIILKSNTQINWLMIFRYWLRNHPFFYIIYFINSLLKVFLLFLIISFNLKCKIFNIFSFKFNFKGEPFLSILLFIIPRNNMEGEKEEKFLPERVDKTKNIKLF